MFEFDPTVFQILDTENVLVISTDPATFALTTIYQGPADLQERNGSIVYNPAGPVEMADAQLTITVASANLLPSVAVGQLVTNTDTGKTYTVTDVSAFTFAFPHLEIALKVGPAGSYGPTR
jgi:hypothetical protein